MPKPCEKYLLPHKWQYTGWILFILGVVMLIARFNYDFKPEWLNIKTFAVYSSLFDIKKFTVISNNISEEISILFTGAGLFMLTLSKEKNETDIPEYLRGKAFIISAYISFIIFLFNVFFIYGLGFVTYMGLNLFLLPY